MDLNFEEFFNEYEAVVAMAENAFEKVRASHSECIKCKMHCADCCHALFDLTLIEALYINHKVKERFDGDKKGRLEEKANITDRAVFKLKKKAYKEFEGGKSEDEILKDMATKRLRCPLLNEEEKCDLYEFRPITCRLYGIPLSIGGAGHTCGVSGFQEGEKYPTVNMDIIQKKLYEISDELVKSINSKHAKMSEMLVPVSMAILNDYNKEYLGIPDTEKSTDGKK
ncbi:MAG: YkgJ family cysteine cluster protein [Pseudomonadota bacterium]|nr:YkgJ family cysteine cluster protein [Pseudomonadota bacterium]